MAGDFNTTHLAWCPRVTTFRERILHCSTENLDLQILITNILLTYCTDDQTKLADIAIKNVFTETDLSSDYSPLFFNYMYGQIIFYEINSHLTNQSTNWNKFRKYFLFFFSFYNAK